MGPVPDTEGWATVTLWKGTEPPSAFGLRLARGPLIVNSSQWSTKTELEGEVRGKRTIRLSPKLSPLI